MLITIKQETMINTGNPGMSTSNLISPIGQPAEAPINPLEGATAPPNPNQMAYSPISSSLFSNASAVAGLNPGSVYNQEQPQMPPANVAMRTTPYSSMSTTI
jgi:hypothetical protein